MPDVALVLMPFAALERPSIALGILKSAVRRAGMSCEVHYANLWHAVETGLEACARVRRNPTEALVGEWVFAGAAFPEFQPDPSRYLALVPRAADAEFADLLGEVRAGASAFVEATARKILLTRPRIVGCSSMFHQQCASLALLRRIKALDPTVVTVMGGSNCEGAMGRATHRSFPWVDYVVSGEADTVFADLCRHALTRGIDEAVHLPGVFTPQHRRDGSKGPSVERIVLERMDDSPPPDYDEYFETLNATGLHRVVSPGLLIETTRGCWWGQKHHCTFCGLNGSGMNYRSKSPSRIIDEFRLLSERYGTRRFEVVDNIIDLSHIREVLPSLAAVGGYNLFYETKANLKYEQIAQMAAAGVRWMQPGIESMHDRILQLMDKGTTALINVQLLKWARELGVRLSWNFLLGLPGEDMAWYREMEAWLPLVWHLQPPADVNLIRYDRFSPYYYRPDRYGLTLEPCPTYAEVYPVDAETRRDLAYFFVDAESDVIRVDRSQWPLEHREFAESLAAWRQNFFSARRAILSMDDTPDGIEIIDTRPCAVERRHRLSALESAVYRACERARSMSGLAEDCDGRPPHGVAEAVEILIRRKLVLVHGGKILALAVRGELPFLPASSECPGGHVQGMEIP